MLKGEDELLPGRSAALARFAATLTARPWTVTPAFRAEFAAAGLGADAIEAASGIVAMFNYLTRVADASGIEFDYASPLPVFQPELAREPAERPGRSSWPIAEVRALPSFPDLSAAWRLWREYVFDSDAPLTHRERRVLAAAAAQECCDRLRVDELAEYTPRDTHESTLDTFARRLSRAPWRMNPAELQALRDSGMAEPAVLHAISVVALQNAESRLAMGVSLTR